MGINDPAGGSVSKAAGKHGANPNSAHLAGVILSLGVILAVCTVASPGLLAGTVLDDFSVDQSQVQVQIPPSSSGASDGNVVEGVPLVGERDVSLRNITIDAPSSTVTMTTEVTGGEWRTAVDWQFVAGGFHFIPANANCVYDGDDNDALFEAQLLGPIDLTAGGQ